MSPAGREPVRRVISSDSAFKAEIGWSRAGGGRAWVFVSRRAGTEEVKAETPQAKPRFAKAEGGAGKKMAGLCGPAKFREETSKKQEDDDAALLHCGR